MAAELPFFGYNSDFSEMQNDIKLDNAVIHFGSKGDTSDISIYSMPKIDNRSYDTSTSSSLPINGKPVKAFSEEFLYLLYEDLIVKIPKSSSSSVSQLSLTGSSHNSIGFFPQYNSIVIAGKGVASNSLRIHEVNTGVFTVTSGSDIVFSNSVTIIEDVMSYSSGRHLYAVKEDTAFIGKDTYKVFYSDINDPKTFNTLSFFAAGEQIINGIESIGGLIYVFKEGLIEAYYPVANANTPFTRQIGADINFKTISSKCSVRVADDVYISGIYDSTESIFLFRNGQIQEIGNRGIRKEIINSGSVENIYKIEEKGEVSIVVKIGYKIFSYMINSGVWTRRYFDSRKDSISSGLNAEWCYSGLDDFLLKNNTLDSGVINYGFIDNSSDSSKQFEEDTTILIEGPNHNNDDKPIIIKEIQPKVEILGSDSSGDDEISLSASDNYGDSFFYNQSLDFGTSSDSSYIYRFFDLGFFKKVFKLRYTINTNKTIRIIKQTVRMKSGWRDI